jgi:OPA family glycerol-3-phosphate transporter-like MFS transporter
MHTHLQSTGSFRFAQWRMLLVTMFCYLFYYTGRQTFGFAIPGIEQELGLDKQTLGWCSAALLWSYAIGQAINGNLGDKFGGRRMMSLGAVLSCGLNWLVSISNGFAGLFVGWGLNGYAQSMGWAPGGRVLSNWWGHHERGKVFGFYVFAAGCASVLSFVTSLLILDVLQLDWRWIFRLPVLLLGGAGILYFLIARDRPQDLGFDPPAEALGDESTELSEIDREATDETSFDRYRCALGNLRFMIAAFSIGFQNLARYGLLIWVPVYFMGKGWKESNFLGPWGAVALPVGMALGALVSGWISDRLLGSRRWPIITTFMLLATATSGLMFITPRENALTGLVLLFFSGFLVYGPQSVFWALCPDLLGRERSATGTGVMNCVAYIFAGLGEPLIGWAIDARGDDDTGLVFLIVAIACLCSAALGPFIRR